MSTEEIERERRLSGWNPYEGEEETSVPKKNAPEKKNWEKGNIAGQGNKSEDLRISSAGTGGRAEAERRETDQRKNDQRENDQRKNDQRENDQRGNAQRKNEQRGNEQKETGQSRSEWKETELGNAVWGEYMPGAECPLSFVRYEQMAASFEMEKKEEEDLRRLQTMYPQEAKQLLPFIEDVCDRMEYNGSTMFDEHPDLETIYRLQDEIISQVSRQTEEKTEIETGEGTETGTKTEAGPGYPEALVRVLLLQEMHRRRSRRRVIRRQS